MAEHKCDKCVRGEEDTCDCACHVFDHFLGTMEAMADAIQAKMQPTVGEPMFLGTTSIFTQLVHPGVTGGPGVPWPCGFLPIVTALCTPRVARYLGVNFWN